MSDIVSKNTVYVIIDKVAGDIACAFVAPNDPFAERNFLNLLSSPDSSVFSLNPDDFILCKFNALPEEIRKASDYSPDLIHRLRSERAAHFIDNVKEAKKDE